MAPRSSLAVTNDYSCEFLATIIFDCSHSPQVWYIIALFRSDSLLCILLSHTRNSILLSELRNDVR